MSAVATNRRPAPFVDVVNGLDLDSALGDDRLRRGLFVGVVASRGSGWPRKTPEKQ